MLKKPVSYQNHMLGTYPNLPEEDIRQMSSLSEYYQRHSHYLASYVRIVSIAPTIRFIFFSIVQIPITEFVVHSNFLNVSIILKVGVTFVYVTV